MDYAIYRAAERFHQCPVKWFEGLSGPERIKVLAYCDIRVQEEYNTELARIKNAPSFR